MEPELTQIPVIKDKIANGLPALSDKAPSAVNSTPDPDESNGAGQSPKSEQKSQLDDKAKSRLSEYEVKPGQTLWKIADEVLGDGNLYPQLLQLNPSLKGHADAIHPGQMIKLP